MSVKKPNSAPNQRRANTITALSVELKTDRKTLETWRRQGCPGLPPNEIDMEAIKSWAAANGKRAGDVSGAGNSKEAKLIEEIRKLKIANDAKEGALVPRAWVAERIQRAAGELNAARTKSEAEHPLLFAAAAGDVAATRTIVRGIWDDIFMSLQSLRGHFEQ